MITVLLTFKTVLMLGASPTECSTDLHKITLVMVVWFRLRPMSLTTEIMTYFVPTFVFLYLYFLTSSLRVSSI